MRRIAGIRRASSPAVSSPSRARSRRARRRIRSGGDGPANRRGSGHKKRAEAVAKTRRPSPASRSSAADCRRKHQLTHRPFVEVVSPRGCKLKFAPAPSMFRIQSCVFVNSRSAASAAGQASRACWADSSPCRGSICTRSSRCSTVAGPRGSCATSWVCCRPATCSSARSPSRATSARRADSARPAADAGARPADRAPAQPLCR